MKKYLLIAAGALLISGFTFNKTASVKLTLQEYTLQLPEGPTHFTVDETQVSIRFKKELSPESIAAFFRRHPAFQTFEASWKLPFPNVYVAKVRDSKQAYTTVLESITASDEVQYAAPVLVYRDEVQQALYDLFFVKLKNKQDLGLLQEQAALLQFDIEREYEKDIYFCRASKVSKGNTFELAKHLQDLDLFAFAEPDFVYWGQTSSNDPLYASQWHLNNTAQFSGGVAGADLDIVNAWGITSGIPEIKVAILDCFGSAAQFTHPDFAFASTYDATGVGFNSTGFTGDAHGINCGGLIGANTNNNVGVAGIAYGASVIAVKIGSITNSSGNWTATGNSISDGITWAYQHAHVLSNSNSLGSSSSLIDNAIANSVTIGRWGKGAPFFSSSGNNSISTISYPSSNTNTIAVGASDVNDTRASFSNYGTGLDIAAPGVNVYSTDMSGSAGYATTDYFLFSGTSAACPVAAGVMALILSADSTLTHAQARAIMESSCEKVGGYTYAAGTSGQPNGTWTSNFGYGRINAFQAVSLAKLAPDNDQSLTPTTLTIGTTCSYVNGSLFHATESMPPTNCSGSQSTEARDVWYAITPTQSNVTISCQPGTTTDAVLGIYAGTASSPLLLECTDVNGPGGLEVLNSLGLVTGSTYYIRVYDFNANAYGTDFKLCVKYTPVISNNTFIGAQGICLGATATQLTGSTPAGGWGTVLTGYRDEADFPNVSLPTGWSVPLNQDTILRGSTTLNSYGRAWGTGAILANNYSVTSGRRGQLQTAVFTPCSATDSLRFDIAHAAYTGHTDSLVIYTSSGGTFTRLTGWGSSATVNTTTGITTANATTSAFSPTTSQWTTKAVKLPAGTTQVRFEFYSDFGNQLYLDNVLIDNTYSYAYQWLKSTTSATSGFAPASGTNDGQHYAPGALTQTTWFRRLVTSSVFTDTSAAVAVQVSKISVGFTTNNVMQTLTGNHFVFTDTTAASSTRTWNFGDGGTASATPINKSYVGTGIYTVKLRTTNTTGCADSTTSVVKVLPNAPTVYATNLLFSNVTANSMQLTWTNGNGQRRIVIAKATASVNAVPDNGTAYAASALFGAGQQLGTGNYVVYKGTGNAFTLANLANVTLYQFAVIELNGDTSLSSYQAQPYLTGNNSTLPVKWLSFTASLVHGHTSQLDWTTASEENNNYFEVQRSLKGNGDWEAIGKVKGSGNSSTAKHYGFADDVSDLYVQATDLYYRIRQVDFDGKSGYSQTEHIYLERHQEQVTVYPNPFRDGLTIATHATSAKHIRVQVTDVTGRVVYDEQAAVSAQQPDVQVSFSGTEGHGIYFVKIDELVYKLIRE